MTEPEIARPPHDQSQQVVTRLRAAGCVFAEDEAAVLLEATSGGPELDRLVARRAAGEPLEHVVGWADFAGLRIHVEPGVFVPRRRSELLARLAVAAAGEHTDLDGARDGRVVVVDLCCGSGAIGAVVAADAPAAEVHAADVDPAAVHCARRNLPPGRVHLGDLFEALPSSLAGAVDVLVVNAPYVPTGELAFLPSEAREHEPPPALDGGADGLDLHRRVAIGSVRWLSRNGQVLIETSEHQCPGTAAAFRHAGFTVEAIGDSDLDATVVRARHPGG